MAASPARRVGPRTRAERTWTDGAGRGTSAAAQAIVTALLQRLRVGRLIVVSPGGTSAFGPGGPPDARVVVQDPRTWVEVATRGGRGLGRAYIEGWWTADDLVALVRLLIANLGTLDRWRNRWHRFTAPALEPVRRLRRPDPSRDRENISAHYDLDNGFFATFLDETMTYSSGVFASPAMSLAEAQVAKLDRLCRKLDLQAGQRVLEIGSGWGSFALHAAGTYGCHVTTTTISAAQYDVVRQRVAAAGLADRVVVLQEDYRSLRGQFDTAVSIEMIEAVDWRDHDTYFGSVCRLLRPDGRFGLQAILVDDRRYERLKVTTDFMRTYVFPGGCLPSMAAILASTTRSSDFQLVDVEDLSLHYAETLSRWAERLGKEEARLVELGFDDRLRRLWEFYLAYCEGAFRERHVTVAQMVLARSGWRPECLGVRPN